MDKQGRSPRQRKLSSSTPQKSNYYAGARFETTPTMTSLPALPMRWTSMSSPLLRSQSMPSSPITTNMMGMIGSGEGRPATTPVSSTVFKSASFPGDSSLLSLFRVRRESSNAQEELITKIRPPSPVKVEEEKVDLIKMLIQASPRIEEELKKKVREPKPVKLIPRSCQFYNGQEYKDISNHLKSLLNVSA